MNEPGFTKGPWTLDPVRAEGCITGYRLRYPDSPRVVFCEVFVADGTARLIAASPTMAEYIQRKADEGDEEAARIMGTIHARRASRKARGHHD